MIQLPLPYLLYQDKLKFLLERRTGKPVSLIITDNSTRILSVKSGGNSFSVRLHWMFLHAGEEVISEVASFMKNRRRKTPFINAFIRENRDCIRRGNGRPFRGNIQGKYFNLKELFDALNQEYFDRKITASIEWGRRNMRRVVRRRILGSYCRDNNIIRIHPILDRKNVPLYYINYVIYHEMLHSALGMFSRNGRKVMHSPEFRRRERMFGEYGEAKAWNTR